MLYVHVHTFVAGRHALVALPARTALRLSHHLTQHDFDGFYYREADSSLLLRLPGSFLLR